jgi:hypothetical protein
VHRRTRSGQIANPAERVLPGQALAGYLTSPQDPGGTVRSVAPGQAADLVLLRVPLAEALSEPSCDLVAGTVIGGTIAWQRP